MRSGLVLALLLVACGHRSEKGQPPADHADEHGGHGGDSHAAHAKDGEGTVRIEPDMLRDLRITTAKAQSRPAGESVTALGDLRVDEDAYAEIAAPVSARVISVLVQAGQSVTSGQPLAELESADLGRARAEHAAALARLSLAKETLERKRRLAGERIVPAREVQEAEAELARAEGDVRAAQASVGPFGTASRGESGARITLRSPIAGTVIERQAVRGQLTDPARPLFRVGDLSRLWLTVHAFERDAVRLATGVTATVSFLALPGRTFPGKVTYIGREVDTSSRTIDVRVTIDNPEGTLRPGMAASADIPLGNGKERVIAVPVAAVQQVEERWVVFVPASEPGVYALREVGRGRELGGQVELLQGLAEGETVVVEGAFMLRAEVSKAHGEGGHEH